MVEQFSRRWQHAHARRYREGARLPRAYLNLLYDSEINWAMIRAVFASVADIAIVPLQDVLGLGTEARMNLPGA